MIVAAIGIACAALGYLFFVVTTGMRLARLERAVKTLETKVNDRS